MRVPSSLPFLFYLSLFDSRVIINRMINFPLPLPNHINFFPSSSSFAVVFFRLDTKEFARDMELLVAISKDKKAICSTDCDLFSHQEKQTASNLPLPKYVDIYI